MKDHNTKPPAERPKLETEARDHLRRDHFDAALVFADPVAYLAGFGLRSELTETRHSGFPAAA